MNALHTYTYDYDGNGNVVDVLDTNGTSVAHYEYDPFGRTVIKSGTFADDNHWRFSTKYQDETGLYYYGYRYYSPELGRWPSRDPIGEKGGINVYAFVGNGMVNKFDVLGLLSLFPQPMPGAGDTWEPPDDAGPISYFMMWLMGFSGTANISGDSVLGMWLEESMEPPSVMGDIAYSLKTDPFLLSRKSAEGCCVPSVLTIFYDELAAVAMSGYGFMQGSMASAWNALLGYEELPNYVIGDSRVAMSAVINVNLAADCRLSYVASVHFHLTDTYDFSISGMDVGGLEYGITYDWSKVFAEPNLTL